MRIVKHVVYAFLIIWLGVAGSVYVKAQTQLNTYSPYSIEVTPTYPKLGQKITLTVNLPVELLKNAVWVKDGEILKHTYRQKTITLTLDKPSTIQVFYQQSGQLLKLEKRIEPFALMITKEPVVYSFMDKLRPAQLAGADIKLTAYLQGNANDYYFSWEYNGQTLKEGYGANSVVVTPIAGTSIVFVQVIGEQSIYKTGVKIIPTSPKLLVYGKNFNTGHQSLISSTVNLADIDEIEAVPEASADPKSFVCSFELNNQVLAQNTTILSSTKLQKGILNIECSDTKMQFNSKITLK